ncbi:MAG: tetratricopeptide repeat protein [Myxococcota bacterium]|nr:tetratricopeptide repeat protein [Myxococcota bacterium]
MTEEIHRLQASLEQNPQDREAFAALDEIYQGQSDWRALLDLYTKHPGGAPDGQADELLAQRLRSIASELDDRKSKGALLVELGDVYFERLGRREEAMSAYQESFKVYPKDTTCLERARSIYSEAGDFERVIVLYELQSKVLKKSNRVAELARTYIEMAEIFGEHLDNTPRALEMFVEARDLDPETAAVGDGLFERYRSSDDVTRRIVELIQQSGELAAVNGKESSRLMLRAARLEWVRQGGSIDRVVALLERAVERDENNEEAIELWEQASLEREAASEVIEEDASESTDVLAADEAEDDGFVGEPTSQIVLSEEEAAQLRGEPQETLEEAEDEYILEEIDPEDSEVYADAPETMLDPSLAEAEAAADAHEEITHEATDEEVEALANASATEIEPTAEYEPSEEELARDGESTQDEQSSREELDDADLEDLEEESAAVAAASVQDDEEDATWDLDPDSIPAIDDATFDNAVAALKKDPTDLETLEVVKRELIRRREWDELVDKMGHSVKYLRRKDGEFEVMLELAMILWKEVGDMDKAEYYFKRLRHNDAEMVEVLDFYEEFLERSSQWRKLHLHLVGRLQHFESEGKKRRYTKRIAHVAEVEMTTPEKAIDAWRTFLEEFPDDMEARTELRRLYEEHEKWNALVEYLRAELDSAPDDDVSTKVTLLEEVAAIYRDKVPGGDLNRINALNQLLELDPGHRNAFDELKELLEGNRRYSELATLLSNQADAAAENGDIGRAIEMLTEVADLWQERLNNITQALPFLQRILELDPYHDATRERLKEVYTQRRDYPSLYELLEHETEGKVGDDLEEHLRELLALAQERLRDNDKAEQLLERLLEMRPDDRELLDGLEGILRRKDAPQQLANLLERKARLEDLSKEETIAAYKEAAQICDAKLGDAERAAGFWRQVLLLDEANATAFARLRDIYVEHRRYDDLFELFQERDVLDRYYDTLDAMTSQTEDVEEIRDIYRRMANLAERQLSDEDKVISSLESLLEHSDEARPEIARELIGWYRQVGDLGNEIEMHKLLLEAASDDVDRFAELVRLAELEIEREEDEAALRWQLEALSVMPDDDAAIAKAEELARHVDMLEGYLDHLEAIADTLEDNAPLQRKLLERVASLSRDELEDNARSISIFERLNEQQPEALEWLEALESLYEIAAYPDKRIATLRKIIALLEQGGAGPEDIVAQLSKIADVQHRHLGEQEQALSTYKEILEVNQDFTPAIRGLREIHALEGEWDAVIEMLGREFNLTDPGDDDRRIELHMELASVWLTYKERPDEALRFYQEVLIVRPGDEGAIEKAEALLEVDEIARDAALLIEPVLREGEDHARLANALEARLRVSSDPYESLEIYEELVPLYWSKLERAEDAFPHAARRFELEADNDLRWQELEKLAEELDKWAEVEALFAAWSPLTPEQEDDHNTRVPLLRHVAKIRQDRLGDVDGALEAWERLYHFEPNDSSVVEALEALYRSRDDDEQLVRILDARSELVDMEQRVQLLLEAAMLSDGSLEDVSRAIVFYQRVLEIEPQHAQAVKELEGLLRAEERYFDLDELFTEQARLADEPMMRRNFLLQQSALRTQNLKDFTGAFGILQQLIAEDDSDPRGVMLMVTLDRVVAEEDAQAPLRLDIALELEKLYRDKGDYPKLIAVLEVRLSFTEDPFERIELLDELSEQHRTHVVDHARAFERTREAVLLMPDQRERRELLEQLGDKLDRMEDVVIAYAEAAGNADDPFISAPLYKRSGQLLADHLDRREEAIDAYERALEVNDSDAETYTALEGLYTYTSDWEKLAENLRAQAGFAEPDRRMELLRRIGELEESQLERPEEAIEAWAGLLEMDNMAMDAIDALERLYRNEERWVDLTDILRQKANLTDAPEERLEVLHDLAKVHEARPEEIPDAINVYREMRLIDAEHPEALDALDRLFKEEGSFTDLSEVLEAKLRLADNPADRTTLALRRARILAEELLNIDEALDLYLEVFGREPGQEQARAALEHYAQDVAFNERCATPLIQYYRKEEMWQELVELYEVMRDQTHDFELQADHAWEIAQIQRDRIGDLDAALEAASQAWRLRPTKDEWRMSLRAIADAKDRWADLAQVYEDVLLELNDPDRLKPLRIELAEIYREQLENPVDAEQQYREALNLDERDLGIYEALETMLADDSRWQALIELLDRRYMVFAGEPGSNDLLLRIANIWDEFVQDQFAAIDAYRRVLVEVPESDTAASAIKRLYRQQENYNELAMFLEDRLGLYMDDPERTLALRTELADIYAEHLREPERALDLWRLILDDQGHHEPTIASLEQLFEQEEMMRESVGQVLEPIYRERQQWQKLVDLLSLKVEQEGDPFTQVELLRDIARISETELRDWGKAIESYGRIFAQVPEDENIRNALSRLGERLNAWPQIVTIYEDTLLNNFNVHDQLRGEMLLELGLIQEERLGKLEDARDTFARIREFEPAHKKAFDALERVNQRLDDSLGLADLYLSYADAEYDQVRQLELLDQLVILHEEVTGDLHSAIEVCERMLQIDAMDTGTASTLERLYKETGRFDDLADLYRNAVGMVADDPQRALAMRYRLAQLLESELDQIDEAMHLYQGILADQPGHRDTLRALEGLRRDLSSREGDWDQHLGQIAQILLDNYNESSDWRRIVDLLDLKQSSSEDVYERIELLGQAAEVVERHADERADLFLSLGFRTTAWTLEVEPGVGFSKLEPIADRLDAWERVLPQILEGLEDTETPEEKARLLNAIAKVYQDKLDDNESALIAFEQTLELEPSNEFAVRQLEGLYGEFEHWRPLVNLLRVMLDNTFDGQRRINLLLRIANLHEDILDEPDEAIRAYEELRELDASSRSYLDALCALYERTDRDNDLVDALQARVEMIEDRDEQLGTLKKLAQIQHEIVDDKIGAIDTYRRIFTLDDSDELAVRALVSLYGEQGSWHELLEMLEVQREFAADVETINQVEFRMAEIMLDRVDQPFEALERLRRIAERDPDWTDAIETMGGLLDNEMVREEAFSALEELHRTNARWQPLANLYEKRIDYLEDPHQRTGTFLKLANLQEGQLGSSTSALMTYGRAFRDMPTQESVRVQLERLAEELDNQEMLIGFYEDALAEGVDDSNVSLNLHMRLGELYIDEREEADPAITHLEAVLEIDEYHIKALELLDKLYQFKERYDDLADVLQRQIAVAPPEALAQARYRLGYLRERIFDQPLDAFDLYRQVIDEQPEHRKVTEALERLIENEALQAEVCDLLERAYMQTENWGKLVQLLKIKLEHVADSPHERAELMCRVAKLERDREQNFEAAFEYFGRAFVEDPFSIDTQEMLEELGAEQGYWQGLVDLYDGVIENNDDPVRRGELALKAAEWSRLQLGDDLDRSHRLYTVALEVEPQNLTAINAMEMISRQRGDQAGLIDWLTQKVELLYEPEERFAIFQELGHLHADQQNYMNAIDALREAAMIEPGDADVIESLVGFYEVTEQWFDMIEQLEQLLAMSTDPDRRLALCQRIGREVATHLEDPMRALDYYERAMEMSPGNLELLRAVEPLYSQTGQLDRLGEVLDQQLELAESEEDRVRVMCSRAKISYEHHNDAERAIALFKEAYQLSPTSAIITEALDEIYRAEERWVDLFNLYYSQLEQAAEADRRAELAVEMARLSGERLGDMNTAVQYLDFALSVVPGHMPALLVKEKFYTEMGDWGQVTAILGEQFAVAEDDATKIELLLRRAALNNDTLGQPQAAIDDYVEVLNLDIDHTQAYDTLVTLLNELKAWEQLYQVMSFRVSAMAEDQKKQMFLDMAQVAKRMDRADLRTDALEKAYQLEPDDLDVVEPLLDATISAGQFDRATPLLEEVINALTEKRRMKDVVRFYHLRGKLSEEQGNLAGALEDYEAARKIDATYVPNLLSLGKVYYHQQDWDNALKILQTLLLHQMKITDDEAKVDMYYYLGQVRLQKDDARRAKDMFNRALGVNPDHEPSKAALANL